MCPLYVSGLLGPGERKSIEEELARQADRQRPAIFSAKLIQALAPIAA